MKKNSQISITDLLQLEAISTGPEFFRRQRVSGLLSGKHRSSLKGRGLDFSEVRKYILGDDIRNIDWKVTARTRVTHTKVFSEEKERPQLTILDLSRNTLFGSKYALKCHIVLKVAAIHGFRALKIGDRFGAILLDDLNIQIVKPSRSRQHFQAILDHAVTTCNEATSRAQDAQPQVTMEEALSRLLGIAHHDYIINIVTDASLLSEQSIEFIGMLAQSNSVMITHIIDPFDILLPEEKIPFSDTNYQIDWKIDNDSQEEYKQVYLNQLSDLEDKLAALNVPFLKLRTDKDLKHQLKEILDENYQR
ncbi:DUF58 domain-containing protein [Halosquirtibacter xylanolyticus]|uniref:DUF58 domain-containing protein n=1 Tax=Halosquirtibacter xylanolyticus TaxID=3374599 RepID=UPI003749E96B|nr:DUF58 domain-containing protein [Prolixibacteraceae bacterium]